MFELFLWAVYGFVIGLDTEAFSQTWWVALLGPHTVLILSKVFE